MKLVENQNVSEAFLKEFGLVLVNNFGNAVNSHIPHMLHAVLSVHSVMNVFN